MASCLEKELGFCFSKRELVESCSTTSWKRGRECYTGPRRGTERPKWALGDARVVLPPAGTGVQ